MSTEITKEATIGVLGAGTMGNGIAQVAAGAGHRVILLDANAAVLDKARAIHHQVLDKLVAKGKLTPEAAKANLSRIHYAANLDAFAPCKLVIEAIVEDLDVKRKVFAEIERWVAADAVIATNTSSLSVTSIAAACKQAERVLGVHFFNPAPLMPLVEIIPALQTESTVVQATRQLIDGWGKATVLVRDTPGFIVNRVARPFYGESIRILEERWHGVPEGPAGMATIDWAMKEFGGFRMGPFELMDMIGNDINYTVTETVWKQTYHDPRYRPSLTQKRVVEAGRFGKKTGRGYYDYTNEAVIPEPVKDEALGKKIVDRVVAMLINEAVDALHMGIANRDDLETAMTKGVNYPKGLLRWCDELGADKVLNVLRGLRETYEEDRYRPSVLLKQMATSGQKFHA